MFSLRSLFTARPRLRTFAYVDAAGRCQAFQCSAQAPLGLGWIEVREQQLSWLNQPLPAQAKILASAPHRAAGQALPA